MLSISIEHDPRSGTWDVGHTGPGGHKGRWNTVIPPRYPTWRSSCACLPADGQFAEDAATELGRVVRGVQSRCPCKQCGKALESAEWLDPAAARVRRIPIYVPERAQPVAWTDAEVAAEVDDLTTEIAGLVAEQEQLARKHEGRITALEKVMRPPDGSMADLIASQPPTYASTRKRFMETGTIADKEAMLEFVTMDEPDLERLGRDWEPKPPPKPQRAISEGRRHLALAVASTGTLLAVLNVFLLGGIVLAQLASLALVAGALALNPPRRRRK